MRVIHLLICFSLILSSAFATFAQAATFTADHFVDEVDANLGDTVCATEDGDCTLRAAIMEANANPGEDTIELVSEGRYALELVGLDEELSVVGDLDVFDDLIINGNGAILDAAFVDRIFDVESASFQLVHVTLLNGDPEAGGGAIRGVRSSLLLDQVVVMENLAGGDGGGVLLLGGELTISDSAFDTNAGIGGGAIFTLDAAIEISNTTFHRNAAEEGGGAYFSEPSRISIHSLQVLGNHARRHGGGLFLTGYTGAGGDLFTLSNVTFSNNTATGGYGGGLFVEDLSTRSRSTALQLDMCQFTGNSGGHGGGVWIDAGTVRYLNCQFESNSAVLLDGVGGAVYQADAGEFVSTVFNNNRSFGAGGAIFSEVPFSQAGIETAGNLSFTDVENRPVHQQDLVDSDGDGVADYEDFLPNNPLETRDSDLDGIGDFEDLDDDNDGVVDAEDDFPNDGQRSIDPNDSDGDGWGDARDEFPNDPAEVVDTDLDGIGNNADTDDDADGFSDAEEERTGSDSLNPADTPESHRPDQPIITMVSQDADNPLTYFFVGTDPFSDPDGEAFATEAVWRITDASGDLIFERRSDVAIEVAVPVGLLVADLSYGLSLQVVDSTGLSSDISDGFEFTTVTSNPEDADANGIEDDAEFSGRSDVNRNGTDDAGESGLLVIAEAESNLAIGMATSGGDIRFAMTMSLDEIPGDITLPGEMLYGLFGFRIDGLDPGEEVEVTFFLPEEASPEQWYQYDQQLGFIDLTSVAEFDGSDVVVTYTDGGLGDLDGVANGSIIDPSGPVGSNQTPNSRSSSDSRCFVATAVFGQQASETEALRTFRDQYLLGHAPGRAFVRWYYSQSPQWVSWAENKPIVKGIAKRVLKPIAVGAEFANNQTLNMSWSWLLVLLFVPILLGWRICLVTKNI